MLVSVSGMVANKQIGSILLTSTYFFYFKLMPKDAEIAEMNKRKILLAKEDAKKLNVVLLTVRL